MDDLQKIYTPHVREEITRMRKVYGIPHAVMDVLSKQGLRGVRWSSDAQVENFHDYLESEYGDNFADATLGYVSGLMHQISTARTRVQNITAAGKFETSQRPPMEDYLADNLKAVENYWDKMFSRTRCATYQTHRDNYMGDRVLFAAGTKGFSSAVQRNHVERLDELKRWHSSENGETEVVEECQGHYSTIKVFRNDSDKVVSTGCIVKVGHDWKYRQERDMHSVVVNSKNYLVTHCRKVDHPYVDEPDRDCYKAHIVGVNKKEIDYQVGYLVVHKGHSKVTKAFSAGNGGAKTASQLLDRRLRKSVVDTLMDNL